jgi:hypothetical protein
MPPRHQHHDGGEGPEHPAASRSGEDRAPPVQDAGLPAALAPPGAIFVYHVHGRRQLYGTCKLHLRPDCPALVRWRPEMHRGQRLAKVAMREWFRRTEDIPERDRCRVCWRSGTTEREGR